MPKPNEGVTSVTDDIFDIAVIGGGINGVAIARDAAGRGAKVILLEKDDLASGTSSASTKLIHGGLRYLEHFEFKLVRESLIEREILWGIAPHIIWPMRFVLPYQKGLRPRWLLRLGLFLYDHIGGRKRLPATRSISLRSDPAGEPLKPEFRYAFEYSDCWVDDARLVALTAQDAAKHGAVVRTRTPVTNIKRGNEHWEIEAAGSKRRVLTKAVVNAAGPAVLKLLEHFEGHIPDPNEAIRLVRGSHIVVRKLFEHDRAYFFQNPDGRIFFAIPYEADFTLIGTTDADHVTGLDKIHATPEEIEYLCGAANAYFRRAITPGDVVWSYSGVRPLVDDGSGKPETASRGYHFDLDLDANGALPMLSVFGGKITTHRHLAETALAELTPYFPALSGPSWTATSSLPGGDFAASQIGELTNDLLKSYPFLDARTAARLMRCYGTQAQAWLGSARSKQELGHDFGHGLSEAEVNYLVSQEFAISADDILWRRSKLGLHFTTEQTAKLSAFLDKKNM